MRKDYHMHPMATQAPERFSAFVETALAEGIEEICVTDHMPLSFIPDGTDRIPHGKVKEYIRRVRDFAELYRGTLSVKCGIEIDYHPSVASEIEDVLSAGDFDYIHGSTHIHVFLDDLSKYTFNDLATVSLENQIRAAETGLFHSMPHIEMYRFLFAYPHRFPLKDDGFDLSRHEPLIRELLRKVKEKNMYLEINPNLARQMNDISYTYPSAPVMAWAREAGVRFSYGSDAHLEHQVGSFLPALRESPVYRDAIAEWER